MSLKRKGKASSESWNPDSSISNIGSDGLTMARTQSHNAEAMSSPPHKKPRQRKKNPQQDRLSQVNEWPIYFQTLFKAINTVLAFVSSKRQLATSFSSIRSSVEGILKQPLEIARVSEIKALLPDLLKFSYVPISDLQLNEEAGKSSARFVDYSTAASSSRIVEHNSGQVLVLEFVEHAAKKSSSSGAQSYPTSLSPAAVKKLIEARNDRFEKAINELILATPTGDNPVDILITAAQTYIPVDQSIPSKSEPAGVFNADERPCMDQIISEITASLWYKDQIVYHHRVDATEAKLASLDTPVSEIIVNALFKARNIKFLYSHQAAAIDAIRRGEHVVVSTNTASGKSIIYQIPLLTFLHKDRHATFILVFPTKALAQDQKASLMNLLQMCPGLEHLKVFTYDGDTPQDTRAEIRDTASVILTNFDTLHSSILPNEERWRSFLKRLKVLAVDELHYYTGLLGGHIAYILRRFRRICAALGNTRTQFISCSATLANPAEYMSKMFSLDMAELEVVSDDGAPSGNKEYLVWNPPLIDELDPSLGRRSSLSEASHLMRMLMKKGLRVILFYLTLGLSDPQSLRIGNTGMLQMLLNVLMRSSYPQAMRTIKSDLSNEGRLDIVDKIRAYRGGYSREDRRAIEHEAFSGALLGIIATNALELGIDIGALDVVIMLGFPMTVSNFRQQAGRAGRRSQDSLAVMVADPFPIDQHFVKQPVDLFEASLDDLIIDLENEMVLEAHLQCAAHEMPLTTTDDKWFGPMCIPVCKKRLRMDSEGWYHTHPKFLPYPSKYVSIRGAQEETYMVVEIKDNETQQTMNKLEEVEFSRALFELYEGGVFMHQGETFVVKEISHDSQLAKVVRTDINYVTSPRDFTRIIPLQTFKVNSFLGTLVEFGRLNVCVNIYGFYKIKGKMILDAVELNTPSWERETTGFWIDLSNHVLQLLKVQQIDGAAAIHAAEHAFLNQFALSQDIKTDCRVVKEEYLDSNAPATRPPRLIFYDAAGKTGGVVGRAFDNVHALLDRARLAVDNCECSDGCSLCVQSNSCKDANLVSSKPGAMIILNHLLGLNQDRGKILM